MITRLSKMVERWARPGGEQAHVLYTEMARVARKPEFYLQYDISDTFDGRFDTLTLIVVLVVRRLNNAGKDGAELAQEVIDLMFADMDLSLHEIGVSENKVGKKVKTIATAFIGRMKAYTTALDNDDDTELAAALRRNLYRENGVDPVENGLVTAIRAQVKRLDAFTDDELLKSAPSFEFTPHDQRDL